MTAQRRCGLGAAALLCAAGLLAACADPDVVCDFRDEFEGGSVARLMATRSGAFSLAPGALRETRRFRLRITGLSELGTNMPSSSSHAEVSIGLAYGPGQPAGAELPDVDVEIAVILPDGSRGRDSDDSRRFTGGNAASVDILDCWGPDGGCCELGEPECTLDLQATFARDDALFPEVDVSWQVDVDVRFTVCDGEEPLELDLEELDP